MYAGRIVEEGPAAEVLRAPRHPSHEGLLARRRRCKKGNARRIPGTVPQLTALPPGCAFEPRCAVRRKDCTAAVPELRPASATTAARCVLSETGGMRFATEAQRPQRRDR